MGAQAAEGEAGHAARGDRQLPRGGQRGEQLPDEGFDRRLVYQVVVVEQDGEGLLQTAEPLQHGLL
ncbi:hypothetical protein D9M70_646900 [compost metagenome]